MFFDCSSFATSDETSVVSTPPLDRRALHQPDRGPVTHGTLKHQRIPRRYGSSSQPTLHRALSNRGFLADPHARASGHHVILRVPQHEG